MNIFLSWSGDRSKAVAEALRTWLPSVIQRLEPWMSKEDISKGATWDAEITGKLKICPVGIICLTPDNLTAPYLLFEAGAISNNVETKQIESGQNIIVGKTQACTYLYELTPLQVKEPLSKYQATIANKDDTKRLLQTINAALKESKLSDEALNAAFELWWPKLEKSLSEVPKSKTQAPELKDRDILEQILTAVRNLERDETRKGPLWVYNFPPNTAPPSEAARTADMYEYIKAMASLSPSGFMPPPSVALKPVPPSPPPPKKGG